MRAVGTWVKPRLYAEAALTRGPDYFDYEKLKLRWGRASLYQTKEKLGRGKYSDVFAGVNQETGQKVVIKVLKPVRVSKIQREIAILQALKGVPNVVQLLDVVRYNDTNSPTLILDYSENTDFRLLYPTLSDFDIRYYMSEILHILDSIHSRGIMHRDLKPLNLMIDHPKRLVRLIDWGLAEFYIPGKDYHVRVASRYFKAPEFLVGYTKYDYASDMWSFGAMMAGLVFRLEPFFHGADNSDQLVKVARVMGTEELHHYLHRFNITLPAEFGDGTLGFFPKRHLKRYITKENSPTALPDAIDLLEKVLKYDHTERLLPSEALQHAYFTPIRDMWSKIETGGRFKDQSPEWATAEAILARRREIARDRD